MAPSNDFYSTAAQVIPTLLLVSALEGQALRRVQSRWFSVVLMFSALLGEITALHSLYVEGSDVRAFVTYIGVISALWLALLPLPMLLIPEEHPRRPILIAVVGSVTMAVVLFGTYL